MTICHIEVPSVGRFYNCTQILILHSIFLAQWMTLWIFIDRRLMALWSHVIPWEKNWHLQCSAEIYLQWIESASVVIYSGVRVWIKNWGRDDGLGLLRRTAPLESHTDWVAVNSSLWLFGKVAVFVCVCWCAELSVSVVVFVYVWGVACSSEGYL